jgi:hypothetical protein
MHTIALELPVSAAESAALAELVPDQLDRGRLTGDARSRFAAAAEILGRAEALKT